MRMMKEGGKTGKEAWWNFNWDKDDEKTTRAAAGTHTYRHLLSCRQGPTEVLYARLLWVAYQSLPTQNVVWEKGNSWSDNVYPIVAEKIMYCYAIEAFYPIIHLSLFRRLSSCFKTGPQIVENFSELT